VIIKINITGWMFSPFEGVVGPISVVEDSEVDVEASETVVVVSVFVVVLDVIIVVVVGSSQTNTTRPHIIRNPAFLFEQ
jgi:hypothetical protein